MNVREQYPERFRDPDHFQKFMRGEEPAILPFVERNGKMYVNYDYVTAQFEGIITLRPKPIETNEHI
jgi:hypothetical protein